MTASLLICGDCGSALAPATTDSLPRCTKCGGDKTSRFHVVKQNNGRGYLAIRQESPGSSAARVLHADLSSKEAHTLCRSYRAEEVQGVPATETAP